MTITIARAVCQCQERRPDDANYGNFLWYKENEAIEDLKEQLKWGEKMLASMADPKKKVAE